MCGLGLFPGVLFNVLHFTARRRRVIIIVIIATSLVIYGDPIEEILPRHSKYGRHTFSGILHRRAECQCSLELPSSIPASPLTNSPNTSPLVYAWSIIEAPARSRYNYYLQYLNRERGIRIAYQVA